jgi:CheY-like chemotaxis protein
MDDIDASADRAAMMTRQLLTFARRQPMERLPVDLSPMVARSCEWLRGALPPNVALVSNLSADVPLVDADPSVLEQVVMNLAANSRDAMPAGGTLTVTLERSSVGLQLCVADTGGGMDAHTLQHALEPFFTTKPNAVGLGLATAYGIIAELGGELVVSSTEGVGTTVVIHLPASGVARDQAAAVLSETLAEHDALILVVDDEPVIRKVMEQCLTRSGYRVRLAAGGKEALTLLDDVELVISDIRMPEMDGSVLAAKIRELHPTLPILLMSGYCEHAVDRAEGTAFLAKPFELERLQEVIARLLQLGQAARCGPR